MKAPVLKTRLARIKSEALDISVFDLVSLDGSALPGFAPGSHIDVFIPGGLIRQYSLCNGPDERNFYRIAVKREPESRGGSSAMHERLRPGDTITIGPPRNNFALDSTATHHILLGGGIGVTPLLSMAKHLGAADASFELQYFSRSPEHAVFREFLSSASFRDRVALHFGFDAERLQQHFRETLRNRGEGTHLYVCGPIPFMDLLQEIAVPVFGRDRIHLEHFSAPTPVASGEDQAFEVQLSRSGGRYVIPPGRTIADVLIEHDVDILTSCEMGVCGTCITGILAGEPDHRDVYLTDAEKQAGKKIAPCISRAKSPLLVLDL